MSKRGFGLNDARQFSKERGFQAELNIIEAMTKPQSWSYDKFKYAKRGNYLLMWQWKKVDYSLSSTTRPRWKPYQLNCFQQYIGTAEGQTWKKQHNPGWLSPNYVTIPIDLAQAQYDKLKKLADEWGVDEKVLAKIWMLERLRELPSSSQ
jgi:hypothetical protein